MKKLLSSKFLVIAGILALLFLGYTFFAGGAETIEEDTIEEAVPTVTLLSAGSVTTESAISTVGEVRAVSEATLRAKRTGEITRLNVEPGQRVSAGTIIASMENATEFAQVEQAQAALQAQEAALAKTRSGTRQEQLDLLGLGVNNANQSLEEAKVSAVNAYKSTFTLAEDAIQSKADNFFRNPRTFRPRLIPSSAKFDEAVALEAERVALGDVLETWSTRTQSITTNASLKGELDNAERDLRRIKTFLDTLADIVSDQEVRDGLTAGEIDGQEATVLAARTAVDGALSTIAGARQGLTNAENGVDVAKKQEEEGVTGARPEDIQAAEAAVAQARASLSLAQATYEQTLARAPIGGVVSTLSVSRGDFISNGTLIAVVANPAALQIESFVSSALRERLSVGTKVTIDDSFEGVVSSIDPGLDPTTKQARVLIGVTSEVSTLTRGDVVSIVFDVAGAKDTIEGEGPSIESGPIIVPLTTLKIRPEATYVFTVSDEGLLESHTVTIGAIVGDAIQIVEGVTAGMQLVEDVRGLEAGDEVVVSE